MTHEIMNRILTDTFDDIMQNLFICNEILRYGGSVVHAGLVVATGVTLGSSQRSGHARLCQGDCRGGRAVECVAGAAASDASLAVKETDVFEAFLAYGEPWKIVGYSRSSRPSRDARGRGTNSPNLASPARKAASMLLNRSGETKMGTTVSSRYTSHLYGVDPAPLRRTTIRVEKASKVSVITVSS